MAYKEEVIVIKATPEQVYSVAKDAIGFLQRVPGYNITVLEKKENRILFKVSARYVLNFTWHTMVDISNPKEIHFVQVKGILKGLRAAWKFVSVSGGSEFIISHDFAPRFYGFIRLPLSDKLSEKLLYRYCIEKVAQGILKDVKERVEKITGD